MNVLEVFQNNVYLSKKGGFVVLKDKQIEKKLDLDNIDSIIISGFGITYSHNLLQECCSRNIPIIICGKNFMPAGYLYGYPAYFKQNIRFEDQIKASKPFYKSTWQYLIKAKIGNQAQVLKYFHKGDKYLENMVSKVKSDDCENQEGIAARRYWKRLFGKTFTRDFEAEGINSYLNFGYAILRSVIVRNIVAKGLIPALGIHHRNKTNPYCLADDLIEPYRPFVDIIVAKYLSNEPEMTTEIKKKMIAITLIKVAFADSNHTLEEMMKLSIEQFIESLKTKKVVKHYGQIKEIKWDEAYVDDCDV